MVFMYFSKFIFVCMKLFFTILFLFLNTILLAKPLNVLFLGNSYTAYNNLPSLVQQVAWSMGDSINIDSYTPGGFTFNGLSNDATVLSKIQLGTWDFVVLQGQSQEPSFSPAQVGTNTYPYAKKLDSLVKVYNPCVSVLFYMTWGRKYGDASNCANYPPICTYLGMQGRLRESYMAMAKDNKSAVAPVGAVWQKVRQLDSTIELYNPDLSHPSVTGSYLAACTFYASIFGKPVISNIYKPSGVQGDSLIRTATNLIVIDSISTFREHSNLPMASFTTNGKDSFTNTSSNYINAHWTMGDGTVYKNITNNAIKHMYTASGNYIVQLTVIDSCGKSHTSSKNVFITLPTSIVATAPIMQLYEIKNNFVTNTTNNSLQIYDMAGKQIAVLKSKNQNIELPHQNYYIIVTQHAKAGLVQKRIFIP